jgi:hypothetical protein
MRGAKTFNSNVFMHSRIGENESVGWEMSLNETVSCPITKGQAPLALRVGGRVFEVAPEPRPKEAGSLLEIER